MSDELRGIIENDIKEIRAKTFECKHSHCFINKLVPIIINITSRECEEALIAIILDYWNRRKEINRLGKYNLFEIHRRTHISNANKITLEQFQDIIDVMAVEENGIIKQLWIKIAKEVVKNQEVISTLLWLLVTISALDVTLENS